MEIRELKYFLAIAREENISKAAELVHTTQPNLSRQIRKLEDEIGKPLFTRGGRKLELTEAGRLLRKRAEEIVELHAKTETELLSDDKGVVGDIHIGCGESHVMRIVAKAAARTREKYDGIKFHLLSGDANLVSERLDKGLLDFGVFVDFHDMSGYDYMRLPMTDVWGILMRRDCSLAGKDAVTTNDLRGMPLICSQQAVYSGRHIIMNWLTQSGLTPEIAATYNLMFNASLLVEEGVGCAVCLDKIIAVDDESELCFRPLSPRIESHLDIAWKKYRVFPRAAELFLDDLRSVLAEIG